MREAFLQSVRPISSFQYTSAFEDARHVAWMAPLASFRRTHGILYRVGSAAELAWGWNWLAKKWIERLQFDIFNILLFWPKQKKNL